jgi:peptidoglycan/xylan/chitin deacetylase (PgdA/CDA1 family)
MVCEDEESKCIFTTEQRVPRRSLTRAMVRCMRETAKSVLEQVLSLGPSAVSRWLHRRRSLVLAYHNIVPECGTVSGDVSLHLPRARFAAQLDLLQKHCEVVSLQSLVEQTGTHQGVRPRAAITFDDAYQGAVTAGVEELRDRRMPATIFVAPGLLDGRSFWWDDLVPEGSTSLPGQLREMALEALQGSDQKIRDWARRNGLTERKGERHATGASLTELHKAMEFDGLTLAAHSWAHPNLSTVAPDALARELSYPMKWLRERFDRVLPYLAYPYGLGGAREATAAENLGYRASFRIDGGWLPLSGSSWNLPRVNIPRGVSPHGFILRISGILS